MYRVRVCDTMKGVHVCQFLYAVRGMDEQWNGMHTLYVTVCDKGTHKGHLLRLSEGGHTDTTSTHQAQTRAGRDLGLSRLISLSSDVWRLSWDSAK